MPCAVAGLVDLTTGSIVRKQLDDTSFTFSLPVTKFLVMENDADGSRLAVDWHPEYN